MGNEANIKLYFHSGNPAFLTWRTDCQRECEYRSVMQKQQILVVITPPVIRCSFNFGTRYGHPVHITYEQCWIVEWKRCSRNNPNVNINCSYQINQNFDHGSLNFYGRTTGNTRLRFFSFPERDGIFVWNRSLRL